MELQEARCAAKSIYETEKALSSEEQKKRRRKIRDELSKFADQWEAISTETYLLLLQAGRELGVEELDIGAVAGIARQLLEKRPGNHSYDLFHKAAKPLIRWWEQEHGEAPLNKYAGDDTRARSPSEPVVFLANELSAASGDPTGTRMIDIAYRCWVVDKSNAASSSNFDPD